jgi:hypothetical protein
MLAEFGPMRRNLRAGSLTQSQIATLLKAMIHPDNR